jgi:hypothetical protein
MMDGIGTVAQKDRAPRTREDLAEFLSGLPEASTVASRRRPLPGIVVYESLDESWLEFLKDQNLHQPMRMALDNYLKVLAYLNERIAEVESTQREIAEVTEEVKWVMSMPLASDFIMRCL